MLEFWKFSQSEKSWISSHTNQISERSKNTLKFHIRDENAIYLCAHFCAILELFALFQSLYSRRFKQLVMFETRTNKWNITKFICYKSITLFLIFFSCLHFDFDPITLLLVFMVIKGTGLRCKTCLACIVIWTNWRKFASMRERFKSYRFGRAFWVAVAKSNLADDSSLQYRLAFCF